MVDVLEVNEENKEVRNLIKKNWKNSLNPLRFTDLLSLFSFKTEKIIMKLLPVKDVGEQQNSPD